MADETAGNAIPGQGMRIFGIIQMVVAAVVCPLAWMIVSDGGRNLYSTSLVAFVCWNVMFVAGAIFYCCGKIVTQIHLASAVVPIPREMAQPESGDVVPIPREHPTEGHMSVVEDAAYRETIERRGRVIEVLGAIVVMMAIIAAIFIYLTRMSI